MITRARRPCKAVFIHTAISNIPHSILTIEKTARKSGDACPCAGSRFDAVDADERGAEGGEECRKHNWRKNGGYGFTGLNLPTSSAARAGGCRNVIVGISPQSA